MTSALILAAGKVPDESNRKPLDAIGGASSIKRLISVFKQANVGKIVVVSGYDAGVLERHCARMGVVFLRNDSYGTGDMLSSVKIGLRYISGKCQKVFISPVNFPFFTDKTLRSMEDAAESVVIPMFKNKTGHPMLLPESLFDRVLDYSGADGLEGALSGADVKRCFLDVPDEGILVDMRNENDMDSIIKEHSLREIRPEARIRLSCEKVFFDSETLHLLALTEETGSLKQAARQMGISYSKALQMVADAEEQLGYAMLESRQGGSKGGGSDITESGIEFMRRYEMFASECESAVRDLFDKHFK